MTDRSPMMEAKRPRSPLAGPYGHPFHPILVTIPIGAWTASVVFDIIGLFSEDPEIYAVGAQVLIAIGIVGALAAAIWGFMDFSGLAKGTPARRVGVIHMTINLIVVALFVVNFAIRASSDHDHVSIIGLVLSVIGLLALGVSGWLGGKLSYTYGVRVAAEDTQGAGFR
jgi:uncharacterized membrane protein